MHIVMRDGGVLDFMLRVVLNILETSSAPVAQVQEKESAGDAIASSNLGKAMIRVDSPAAGWKPPPTEDPPICYRETLERRMDQRCGVM